jgi:hypothetical protein
MTSTQASIYKDSERVEKMRVAMKMTKNELDEWLKVQDEKEQDTLVLQKYAKEDEAKIKHMTMQIQKRRETIQKKKNQLAQQVSLH